MLMDAWRQSGDYRLSRSRYGLTPFQGTPRTFPTFSWWSRLRGEWLDGRLAYGIAVVLALIALLPRALRRERLCYGYGTTALALVVGSLLQVPIAVLGNGRLDLVKHLYGANVLLDLALVFGLFGAFRRMTQRGFRLWLPPAGSVASPSTATTVAR
jgi:hypothetical protein